MSFISYPYRFVNVMAYEFKKKRIYCFSSVYFAHNYLFFSKYQHLFFQSIFFKLKKKDFINLMLWCTDFKETNLLLY